jgi:hypothetical protein
MPPCLTLQTGAWWSGFCVLLQAMSTHDALHPWLFQRQGDVARAFLGETYGRGEIEFWNMIDAWWKTGTFEGLEFTR